MKPLSVLLLLFLLVSLSVSAQKDKATLYFRNGDMLEGLARMKEDGTVKFRKDKTSEACTYTYKEIFGLKISQTGGFLSYDEIGTNTYHYKIIRLKKGIGLPQLLRLDVKGKMSLYSDIESFTSTAMVGGGLGGSGGGMSMVRGQSVSYFVSKDTTDFVTFFISSGPYFGKKSFKKSALKVFGDCPVMVAKINKREYKWEDIESMVREYNQKCAR